MRRLLHLFLLLLASATTGFLPLNAQNEGVTIVPAEGEVAGLSTFTLTFNDLFLVGFADDEAVEPILLVNDAGVDTTTAVIYAGEEGNQLSVELTDDVTAPGSYTLAIPEGKVINAFTDSPLPAYNFHYTITATDAIGHIGHADGTGAAAFFNAAGQRSAVPWRGLNIVRRADGSTVKIVVR